MARNANISESDRDAFGCPGVLVYALSWTIGTGEIGALTA